MGTYICCSIFHLRYSGLSHPAAPRGSSSKHWVPWPRGGKSFPALQGMARARSVPVLRRLKRSSLPNMHEPPMFPIRTAAVLQWALARLLHTCVPASAPGDVRTAARRLVQWQAGLQAHLGPCCQCSMRC